jgi:hypothetical protein
MDGQRFDHLVRSLAGGVSRRGALKTLVAGVGAAFAATRVEDAAAYVCRPFGTICRKPGDCCGNHCGPKDKTGRRYCGVCPPSAPQACGTEACCTQIQGCIDGVCCDNPCGEGDGAVCCAAGQTCISHFTDDVGFVYSCCDPLLACNDDTICCAEGEQCVTGSVCCLPDNICESDSGTECCGEGTECTPSGCCESTLTCTAPGGAMFCCGEGGTCDDNGCTQSVVCEVGSCQTSEDCIGLDLGNPGCCGGCCVDHNTDNQHCAICDNPCGFFEGDPNQPLCCTGGQCLACAP